MKTSGPLSILLRGAFCVTQAAWAAACPHLLRRSRRITRDSLAHLLPGRDRGPEAPRDGNSLPGRLHRSKGRQEIPRSS